CTFFHDCAAHNQVLHSFPTRRSSDLGNQEVMAVVGIPSKFYPPLDTFEKNLMIAMLDECGLILERRKLRAEKQAAEMETQREQLDRKSTRLNSSHVSISYAVFCLKKK